MPGIQTLKVEDIYTAKIVLLGKGSVELCKCKNRSIFHSGWYTDNASTSSPTVYDPTINTLQCAIFTVHYNTV